MVRARAEIDNRNPIDGKWLCCVDWWLVPVSALRRSRQMLGPTRKSSVRPLPDTQNAKQTFREMKRLNREIHNLKTKLYNAQPSWSLSDIQIEFAGGVPQVVEEFLRLVKSAAAEFCWTLNRPTKEMHWKKHSWKHTTFAEIERIVADANAGRWLPPELRLDQLGSFEEARILPKG